MDDPLHLLRVIVAAFAGTAIIAATLAALYASRKSRRGRRR